MSRRGFLQVSIAAASFVGWKVLEVTIEDINRLGENWINRIRENIENEETAKKVFQDLFGKLHYDRSLLAGRQNYASRSRFHVDNYAAGLTLGVTFGFFNQNAKPVPDSTFIRLNLEGDIILIGGPGSTPLTAVTLGYEGNPFGMFWRHHILPLRFEKIANQAAPSIKHGRLIGYQMEEVGYKTMHPWYFQDIKTKKIYRPEPGKRIKELSEEAFLPVDDYLLVTKLPNFLNPSIEKYLFQDPQEWPQILIFQGIHGIGTRGAELLLTAKGLEALQSVKNKLNSATAFQALFRTTDLGLSAGGYHRFNTIELVDVFPLEVENNQTYQIAHEVSTTLLQKLVEPTT